MIHAVDLSKQYRFGNQVVSVLKNLNLTIQTGECVCLRGPSGTGKTTLLNILGGMLAPSSGRVVVDDVAITDLPSHFLCSYRRRQVGFIFQQFHLLGHLTVMENLALPLLPSGKSMRQYQNRLEDLLARLKISHRKKFPVKVLSGGEQQRVAVVRALVNQPQILLADEPFSNLDIQNTDLIMSLLRELKHSGMTFVLTATAGSGAWEKGFIDRDIAYASE